MPAHAHAHEAREAANEDARQYELFSVGGKQQGEREKDHEDR